MLHAGIYYIISCCFKHLFKIETQLYQKGHFVVQWVLWADVMPLILALQIYQSWLDKSTPYTAVRWVVTLGLSFVYMIRVYLLQVGVLSTVFTLCKCAVGWGVDLRYIKGVVCNNYIQVSGKCKKSFSVTTCLKKIGYSLS